MKRLASFFATLVVPAFLLAGVGANQAMAAEKAKAAPPKQEVKVLVENDKVRVAENRWVPGAESENIARPNRVVRAVKGGTLQRIYPDGKKETVNWKTGEVKYFAKAEPYIVKNIGKSEVVLYVVGLK
jgi:hypothetical protein